MFKKRMFYFTYNDKGTRQTVIVYAFTKNGAEKNFLKMFRGTLAPKYWEVKEIKEN